MANEGRFADRVCLVTGGGRGIGRAFAVALAREGGRVAVASRTQSELDEAADAARAAGGEAIAVRLDVTDAESCEQAVATVADQLGPPSILVSAAGIAHHRARIEKYDYDAWDLTMEINLSGAFRMLKATAPHLFETTGAALLISSTTALKALPRLTAYGATKSGLLHLTRTVANEWAARGVRVNALCPGYIKTELTAAFLETDRLRDEVLAGTPMGRFPEMDEIVEPGLFLLSDAASFITGVWLPVDGGMAT